MRHRQLKERTRFRYHLGREHEGSDQRITYTPATNYYGSDSLTYKVTDADGESSSATLSFTVSSGNDAPIASNLNVSTNEDTAKSGTVSASDAEGDDLSYRVVAGPTHGTLTAFNTGSGAFTYRPDANYHGADSFTFRANDGRADSNIGRVNVAVNAVNDVPVASAGVLSTNEDTAGSGTAPVSNVDGDALTYSVTAGPTHGTLTAFNTATGAYTYTPAANYHGGDSFAFKANDGTVDSNVATVSITVISVNDAPGSSAGVLTTNEDTAGSGTVVAADTESLVLAYSVVTPPGHGILTVNSASGAYTYTPTANYHGGDSFTFKANDGTVDSNVAAVTITVTTVNDIPVAVVDNVTTGEDTALDIAVLANDAGLGDGIPQVELFNQDANGTASVNPDGSVHFAPDANWNGDATFDYRVTDADGESSAASVHVHVDAVNDAPVAVAGVLTTIEDTAGAGNVSAGDTELDVLTYSIVAGPTHGTLPAFNSATGAYSYLPSANYHGGDSFTFKANDGTVDSNVATVAITVTSVNDAPVAANGVLTTNEDTAGTGTAAVDDVDGDTLTYSVVASPTNGTLTVFDAVTGGYTYTPAANYHGGDSFTFKANDGTVDSNVAAITITVTSVNDAPVAANGVLTTSEDTAGSGSVVASDTESDPLSYTVVSPPAHGTLTIFSAATGAYTYQPAANYHGGDSFTFRANDGSLESNVATVTITVTSLNDAPVAVPGVLVTNENTAGSSAVVASDIDGDDLTYSIVASPTHGALTIFNTGTGAYTYVPTAAYHGGDSFTFQANDGAVDSNVAAVTVTVNPVNDAPVAVDGLLVTSEDTAVSSGVGATDIDGDALTYSIVVVPAHGTLPIFNTSTGGYTYQPTANYHGGDSFTFKANDGTVDSNVATATITVTSVNDAPVADDFTVSAAPGAPATFSLMAHVHDADGDALTVELTSSASFGGSITCNASGTCTYTPPPVLILGFDTFTYSVTDPSGLSDPGTVTIDYR